MQQSLLSKDLNELHERWDEIEKITQGQISQINKTISDLEEKFQSIYAYKEQIDDKLRGKLVQATNIQDQV